MSPRGDLLVVGSLGLDTIITPERQVSEVLGGSSTYFALAAGFFANVKLVSVVGTDFPDEYRSLLAERGIDLEGLEVAAGKTFRWTGRYKEDMNTRITLETHLNVFGEFQPRLPESYRGVPYIFLANGPPETQITTLSQMQAPRFIMVDTMNLWIDHHREPLEALLKEVDGLVINDEEAVLLSGQVSLPRAGRDIMQMGPRTVIIKKGSHGVLLCEDEGCFALPAYPLEHVIDPTGAGDAFAGALMGYLASTDELSPANLRRAVAYGTATAAFACEDFSVERLTQISRADIDQRVEQLRELTSF